MYLCNPLSISTRDHPSLWKKGLIKGFWGIGLEGECRASVYPPKVRRWLFSCRWASRDVSVCRVPPSLSFSPGKGGNGPILPLAMSSQAPAASVTWSQGHRDPHFCLGIIIHKALPRRESGTECQPAADAVRVSSPDPATWPELLTAGSVTHASEQTLPDRLGKDLLLLPPLRLSFLTWRSLPGQHWD